MSAVSTVHVCHRIFESSSFYIIYYKSTYLSNSHSSDEKRGFGVLAGPANVLIMPGIHAAHILTRAVPRLTSSTVIGPLLTGLSHSAQIVPMQAGVNQIVDVACLAAHAAVPRGQ